MSQQTDMQAAIRHHVFRCEREIKRLEALRRKVEHEIEGMRRRVVRLSEMGYGNHPGNTPRLT